MYRGHPAEVDDRVEGARGSEEFKVVRPRESTTDGAHFLGGVEPGLNGPRRMPKIDYETRDIRE
jgi:hypothetical protein